MDPFEVRMQFLALLRRLNASQQSIQKVVGFAVKYFPPCGEDLWDCIVEECQKGSINSRINILYFLDSLCETCLLVKSHSTGQGEQSDLYVKYVTRDLGTIVENVVPPGRQGLPNLVSAKQILESWRSKRVIDPQKVDDVLSSLNARQTTSDQTTSSSHAHHGPLSRNEIFKRIEEDRERHKRLRERRWVQPVTHNPASHQVPPLASFMPLTSSGDGAQELTIDIEGSDGGGGAVLSGGGGGADGSVVMILSCVVKVELIMAHKAALLKNFSSPILARSDVQLPALIPQALSTEHVTLLQGNIQDVDGRKYSTMQLLHHLLCLLAFFFSFCPPFIASQWVEEGHADAQYIFFNGTISGHWVPTNAPGCSDYYLGPHLRTYLLVGVNAPWDSNPFVFDLYHLATERDDGIVFTNDSIYNLQFTTAALLCRKDGRPCSSFESWPYYFAGVEMVNLNEARVERVTVGTETGYTVTGDEKTWVSNDTISNRVDIARPRNYTFQDGCLDQRTFLWNSSTPFTYNVTFSNATASATFTLSTSGGNLTLQFAGDRSDTRLPVSPAIELNASDPTKPTFTYANGTAFSFKVGLLRSLEIWSSLFR
ncbi:putative CTD kinase subunit gamma CTK3 C-terminus [Lyophyllum shimeji]|uniref:CTD kinase subunit gamma CTK3 C-terminus n=1 Tax=Lyophyllum shimeji TaxID=47721 RepID=A0A9P3PKM1_LYOSH|nr:putative CTD kinase subunit gamma CTK3 C-terminus [Lyophyllum shimeji]